MKRVFVISFVLLAFFLVINSRATDLKGKFALSAGGGFTLPIGDFAKGLDMGFGGGVEAEYFYLPQFSLGANFNYNAFEEEIIMLFPPDTDEKFKIMSYGIFSKYIFVTEGKFLPYGKFGFNANTPKFAGETGDTKMGISVGMGGMYQANEMVMIGAEAMFHNIFTEVESTQYLTIYGKLSILFGGY